VTVIFRRIAVLAVAGVLALAPIPGHSLGDEAGAIGPRCRLGYETFEFDGDALDWKASASLLCDAPAPPDKPYDQMVLRVSVVLVQATANSVTIPESMIFCLGCHALQHHITRTSPYLTTGIYQVKSAGRVIKGPNQLEGEHFSCFLVKEFEAKPLMAGCPKIR
jgi:hypothetical protein